MFASVLLFAALSIAACGSGNDEPEIPTQSEITEPSEGNNEKTDESMKVNIIIGDKTITAMMEDNAAGRDFLSRLPLEVTLEDFNNTTEKIFYPPPTLCTRRLLCRTYTLRLNEQTPSNRTPYRRFSMAKPC